MAGAKMKTAMRVVALLPVVLLLGIVGIKMTAGDPSSPLNKVPGVQTIYELGNEAPSADVTLPPAVTPTPTTSAPADLSAEIDSIMGEGAAPSIPPMKIPSQLTNPQAGADATAGPTAGTGGGTGGGSGGGAGGDGGGTGGGGEQSPTPKPTTSSPTPTPTCDLLAAILGCR